MKISCDDARLSSIGPDTLGMLWAWGQGPPSRSGSLRRLIPMAIAVSAGGNVLKVEIELADCYLDLDQIQRLAADPRFSAP
jgi:hypothetical protein